MEIIPALIVLVIGVGIYFIPYIVATQNKKQNAGAIGALNFFWAGRWLDGLSRWCGQ